VLVLSQLLIALAAQVALIGTTPVIAEEAAAVGLQKQLLVDDLVISKTTGIRRVLGKVEKRAAPVLSPDRPWEDLAAFGGYSTVVRNERSGKFQIWYSAGEERGIGYAVSEDGIHWVKPNAAPDGKTNLVFHGQGHMSVSLDDHEQDPAHRYKAAYYGPEVKAALAYSADGIQWTSYNQGQPVTGRAADTHNQVIWDPFFKVYRLFTRTDFGDDDASEWRGTRSMTNPDLRANPSAWTTIRSWKFDREGESERWRRQIYALTLWPYEAVHFALMSVYEFPPQKLPTPYENKPDYRSRHERDVMNFYIATSRDGDNWDLSWVYSGMPMVPRGGTGSFDKDMILPASQIVTWNDRHWIYYGSSNERHWCSQRRNAIGLATLPIDRLVGLEANVVPGEMVTRPFKLEGEILEVNVDCRSGQFGVEVLDQWGVPLPGFGRHAQQPYRHLDELRLRARWKIEQDLRTLKGQTIRLRFHLSRATLYSFQVREL